MEGAGDVGQRLRTGNNLSRIEIRFRWRYWDAIHNRYATTGFHCTAEQIAVEHPDAVPVEGTRQELRLPESMDEALRATSVSHFNAGKKD